MNIEDIGEREIKTLPRAIMVNRDDNVAVVLSEVHAGDQVVLNTDWVEVAMQSIPPGHKMAIDYVKPGQPVIKFGEVIGFAVRLIQPGEHVYLHNLRIN
ncbi:MAG: UxaA family hydrolase [Chloroflexota bacterium]|nr:UxaA family hydrolase [Chloroflexota bacterium]